VYNPVQKIGAGAEIYLGAESEKKKTLPWEILTRGSQHTYASICKNSHGRDHFWEKPEAPKMKGILSI
jgi:hypothetical protein